MSMENYNRAVQLIEQYPNEKLFSGPQPDSFIVAAEQALGVIFPDTYRQFLNGYGAGSFGPQEIYGITGVDFENSGCPDAVWMTRSFRDDVELPSNFVCVYGVGDGEYYFIYTSRQGDEGPVVSYTPGMGMPPDGPEVIATDFGEFLLRLVERVVRRLTLRTPTAGY